MIPILKLNGEALTEVVEEIKEERKSYVIMEDNSIKAKILEDDDVEDYEGGEITEEDKEAEEEEEFVKKIIIGIFQKVFQEERTEEIKIVEETLVEEKTSSSKG